MRRSGESTDLTVNDIAQVLRLQYPGKPARAFRPAPCGMPIARYRG
jgi:hypothetical protein